MPPKAGIQGDGIIQRKQHLDSGACPGPDPGLAGMTALFPNYDTVSKGEGLERE